MPHAHGMGRVSETPQRHLWDIADIGTMSPSIMREKEAIRYVLAAALNHPGLFLGDSIGQGRAGGA